MKLSRVLSIFGVLLSMFVFTSCTETKSTGSTVKDIDSSSPESAIADHRPARDTVDWQFVDTKGQPAWSAPTDREWPGEEIGVIGPIIAMGGRGSKAYVAVYDPGGIFIGALYLKEAREDPSRLENLLYLAQARGFIQNNRTIDQVALLRFLSLAREAQHKEMP